MQALRWPAAGLGVTRPTVALLVIGDGRDALRQATMQSFLANAGGYELVSVIEVDDRAHELGFCGAVEQGWRRLRALDAHFDYVFHLEEDWLFRWPFDVGAMSRLLEAHPHVAQVVLKRGPEHQIEHDAGGFVELWPDEYTDREFNDAGALWPWLEHRLHFSTNPSLYRASLMQLEWPPAPRCEEAFGSGLVIGGATFALWGARTDAPWLEHTGTGQRSGTGY